MIPVTLATLLRRARKKKGLSVRELADAVGVSPSFLCRIERGSHARMSLKRLALIAKQLDVPLDEVFVAARKIPPEVERFVLENLPVVRRAMARRAA
jgi:transcriptional regulator with XRE-family HTH domain